jgi:uncharacterized protein
LDKDLYFCKPKLKEMSGLYTIPLSGLKEGRHTYDFEINNKFFELFEESEIKEGDLKVTAELDKRSTHYDLVIRIEGMVRIDCDRCLEMYNQPVICENRLLIKPGKTRDESEADMLTIPADEYELDLSQYIYEFVHLALPLKRTHPFDKKGNSTCDPAMLQKLSEHVVYVEKKIDPRWDELKKLMNDN